MNGPPTSLQVTFERTIEKMMRDMHASARNEPRLTLEARAELIEDLRRHRNDGPGPPVHR